MTIQYNTILLQVRVVAVQRDILVSKEHSQAVHLRPQRTAHEWQHGTHGLLQGRGARHGQRRPEPALLHATQGRVGTHVEDLLLAVRTTVEEVAVAVAVAVK